MTHPGALSLRVSVTDRCSLRCFYCMPPEGVEKKTHGEVLRFEEILRFVRLLKGRFGLSKVHLTGGEPLLRRGIVKLIAMLAAEGLDDLALSTNGLRLGEMAAELKRAGLARVNVSLDSLDPGTYARISRGGELGEVLAGIEAARRAGFGPVKLNAVVLRGYNDGEVGRLARFALERGLAMRFLELMPIGCAAAGHEGLFVPSAEVRARLAEAFSLEPLPFRPGTSSRYYRAGGGGPDGLVGFISPETEPFCSGCRRLRLTSTGQVIGCLARGEGRQVRALLSDGSGEAARALFEAVTRELGEKRRGAGFDSSRPMVSVGG